MAVCARRVIRAQRLADVGGAEWQTTEHYRLS